MYRKLIVGQAGLGGRSSRLIISHERPYPSSSSPDQHTDAASIRFPFG
jgi:hypothetical protein